MFVVGGAAMALAYNMRRTTADVDGVFEPKAIIYEAARRVADRHEKLPADWLNDGVKGLLPGGADRHARVILDLPGITVSVPSPHYLLALKVQAARIDRDQDDIRFLARETGAKTADDVLRIAEQVIGVAAEPGGQVVAGAGPLVRAADPGGVLDRQRGRVDLLAVVFREPGRQRIRSCSNAPHSQRVRRLASLWCGRTGTGAPNRGPTSARNPDSLRWPRRCRTTAMASSSASLQAGAGPGRPGTTTARASIRS